MSLSNILFFIAMEIPLCFTPGPAVLLIVSQAMNRGFRPSLRGALGILTGNAIYFALSAVGLGALLVASSTVFMIIKWCGAGYLIWMGVRMIVIAPPPADQIPGETRDDTDDGSFRQALLVQLSNPKAVVFFTALLPQFIDPNGPIALQFFVLGVISTVIEFPILALYGFAADKGRAIYARHTRWIERVAGGCLVAAGAKLAATRT
jgi:homoserine/homoserine lactone efflux protein